MGNPNRVIQRCVCERSGVVFDMNIVSCNPVFHFYPLYIPLSFPYPWYFFILNSFIVRRDVTCDTVQFSLKGPNCTNERG